MAKFWRIFLLVIVLVVLAVAIWGIVIWQAKNIRVYSIHDDKAAPIINSGDLVIARHIGVVKAGGPVPASVIAANRITAIPLAGFAFDYLKRPWVMIVFVYFPVLLLTMIELKKLTHHYGYKAYHYTHHYRL